jgi:LmbE family N-acetylglucosaminyl deacetylase
MESVAARGRRIAVLSPHLDDAVLSLGASISWWARSGVAVEVVTVFAGDPTSTRSAGTWDRRAGFETEGSAVRGRRDEDRQACGLVGASPTWLPFREVLYESAHDGAAVRSAVADRVAGADVVLLAGPPVGHPDHAWLAALRLDDVAQGAFGLYRAQPYAFWASRGRPLSSFELPAGLADLRWDHVGVDGGARRAKWRAARAYRSQLPLLGLARRGHLPLVRLLWSERRAGGEAVAWLPGRSTTLTRR